MVPSAFQEDWSSHVDPEEEAWHAQGTASVSITSITDRYNLTDSACLYLCQGPEMTKVIQSYNKLAVVLLQYEVLHLQAWSEAAESTPHFLNAALLVRHENKKVLDECGFEDNLIVTL